MRENDAREALDKTLAHLERIEADRDQKERYYRAELQRAEGLLSRLAQAEAENQRLRHTLAVVRRALRVMRREIDPVLEALDG